MGRALALLLAVFTGSAFAQGAHPSHVQRSNFLKPGQYATQTSLALFVDPTGSDSNDCSGTGTSACLTIQAAANLIPQVVAHPVTVDIAAGSYAGFSLVNHAFNAADATTGAYINIRGAAQANTTPATGTATGTITSVSTDAIGFHVVTDSTQTWTASDSNITTRFLTLTGGTGSGQICPIFANTATTISVSCTFSPAPIAGTTYAITTPSVLLTSAASFPATAATASSAAGGMFFANLQSIRAASDSVQVSDIGQSGAFQTYFAVNANAARLNRVRGSGVGFVRTEGVSFTRVNLCVHSGTGSSFNIGGSASTIAGGGPGALIFNTYATTSIATMSFVGGSAPLVTVSASQLATSSATAAVILMTGGSTSSVEVTGSRLLCTSASTNFAVQERAFDGSNAAPLGVRSVNFFGTNSVETCGTGLSTDSPWGLIGVSSGTTLLSNTTAALVKGGGRITFFSAVPAFTTNTTDISVDGVTSTRAAFVALVPNAISNLNYFSVVYLQP